MTTHFSLETGKVLFLFVDWIWGVVILLAYEHQYESQVPCFPPVNLLMRLGKPWTRTSRSLGYSPRLLALSWSSLGCCWHLGWEPVDETILSLSVSHDLSVTLLSNKSKF